jgi:hypothetical protein
LFRRSSITIDSGAHLRTKEIGGRTSGREYA